ncbi:MAG: M48 family metallopeptidase [Tissierellia bacterium]|nr:M48 family metallopeptidase [Tissierellia bacterium]
MDRRLSLSIILFFICLSIFIGFVLVSEYRNMKSLKTEYPGIPEKAYNYRKASLNIWAVNLVLKFLFPLLLLITGLSNRIGIFARGSGRSLFWTGFIYVVIFSIIDLLIALPIDFYGGFILRHRYGFSNQSLFRWLEIVFKNFIINGLVFSLLIWFPYYLIFRSPNRWWLYLGLLAIPAIAFVTFISPMYVDPIFNRYTSIEDDELGREIKVLLKRAGVEGADIYRVDKSRDTKLMNAYMTGVFKSKRIVLWDTTMDKLDRDEVLSITAHEIGHYVRGHIWRGIVLGGLLSIALMYLVHRTSGLILKRSNGAFGFRKLYDIASIPLLILMLNLYMFLASPIINFGSRQMEREADAYEIGLTENKEAAISSLDKLYRESLSLPRPSTIFKIWYHSHPTPEERIDFFNSHGED